MAEIILFQYSFKLNLAPVSMMYIQVYGYQLYKQDELCGGNEISGEVAQATT